MSWISIDIRSIVFRLAFLCVRSAVSPIMMNSSALTIEGPAPVAKVYKLQVAMVMTDFMILADGELPMMKSDFLMMP